MNTYSAARITFASIQYLPRRLVQVLSLLLLSLPVLADQAVPERTELEQAWSDEIRESFWFTSQGSRIMPYDWFLVLEQPDNQTLFRDNAHFAQLGYLPMNASKLNPDALPIGFVKDNDKNYKPGFIGMTCSACHTNQLDYKDKKFLIDGAPTLANFVQFYDRLVVSLNNTYQNDAKFERFAKTLLGAKYNANSARNLRAELQKVALAATERQTVNALPADFPKDFTSFGRLDAFGNIQNAGTAFALSKVSNRNSPTGPVSYPFLWGTHQSDVVQWNASAPNTPVIGPLVRNIGEVVGVFGGLSIEERSWWDIRKFFGLKFKYHSSVDMEGLGNLESWVKTLKSPQWPADTLPAIDVAKAAKGSVLYEKNCASCHQVIPRDQEYDKYKANKTPVTEIGTDPVTAFNASCHVAKSLILEGSKEKILVGDKFGAKTAAINIPVNGVVGMVLKHPIKAIKAGLIPEKVNTHSKKLSNEATEKTTQETATQETTPEYQENEDTLTQLVKQNLTARQALRPQKVDKGTDSEWDNDVCPNGLEGLVYKGRPLNGIWATAPYLHNGSVPSLWQLMLKPEERITTFKVGSREFDPVNVGYITDTGPSEFNVLDKDGKVFPGNSNQGHKYGTELSDEEKWQIVEYMKTL